MNKRGLIVVTVIVAALATGALVMLNRTRTVAPPEPPTGVPPTTSTPAVATPTRPPPRPIPLDLPEPTTDVPTPPVVEQVIPSESATPTVQVRVPAATLRQELLAAIPEGVDHRSAGVTPLAANP